MSGRRGRLKRRRMALFQQQNGLCYWCGCPMVPPPFKRWGAPRNGATIDHLRDRTHPGRREPARGEQRLVAACRDCNERRGAETQRALGIDELHHRSGRYGQPQMQAAE